MSFEINGGAATVTSNIASTTVSELLDLQLSANETAVTLVANAAQAVPFTIVNRGNGAESFVVDATIEGGAVTLEGLAFDSDGDGKLSDADVRIAAGGQTPAMAAGQSAILFALLRGREVDQATLTLTAQAATGTGAPGTSLPGQGGCDAIIGASRAIATATLTLTVGEGSDPAQISLVKSQTVVAPNGSSVAARGSTITYTIESRFGGSGVVRSARLADPIPPGTAYVPGSLRLDGTALTDAADNDAGAFDGAAIGVTLGDVPAPATRRIEFKVTIQ